MNRVNVKKEMLRWALLRCNKSPTDLRKKLPKLDNWLSGQLSPTLKQLESFAKATYTPIGFFFLDTPPKESVPIPDFRTLNRADLVRPSPDLLDTIHLCQQRQEWYRDFERSMGAGPLPFVGTSKLADDTNIAAADIRNTLGFNLEERQHMRTWTDALRRFIELADEQGILVMVSGVVGNNTKRKLNPHEFRGFTLADELAPLIFVNGGDTKSAQMFTLAHELAHIWLGQAALSDTQALEPSTHQIESWCNQVAAELLVPLNHLNRIYDRSNNLNDEINRLARYFKASTLVILRRIYDVGGVTRDELGKAYENQLAHLMALPKGSGGNFYLTQTARVSKRFARALVISTLEGQTLHRDALRMLSISKMTTFNALGQRLGVM